MLIAPFPLNVQQWRYSFDVGKIAHPALALLSSVAYGYVAFKWQGTLRQRRAELFGVAIVFNLIMWPWTIFFTLPTNNKLFKKADETNGGGKGIEAVVDEVGEPEEETARGLISYWGKLNYVRGCFPLIAAILGIWISLD